MNDQAEILNELLKKNLTEEQRLEYITLILDNSYCRGFSAGWKSREKLYKYDSDYFKIDKEFPIIKKT
jgi:hypothetical protein